MDLSFELPTHKYSLKLNPYKLMHEIPFSALSVFTCKQKTAFRSLQGFSFLKANCFLLCQSLLVHWNTTLPNNMAFSFALSSK